MAEILGATTATTQTTQTVTNTSSVSSIATTVGAVAGVVGAVSGLLNLTPSVKLPLPNPLSLYASTDYIISLSMLTTDQINNPDASYMTGLRLPLLAKSANMDPNNRIRTPYGRFDFFIDDVQITNTVGFRNGRNSMLHTLSFTVMEPYSMGMFLQSVQAAALKDGQKIYSAAPFLLKIEFRGAKENGAMSTVPNSTRYIPFRMADIEFEVSSTGCKYKITGLAWASQAHKDEYNRLKNDIFVSGKSVKEVLQSGPNSVQSQVNARFQQLAKENKVSTPDQILILFPSKEEIASSQGGGTAPSTGGSATVNPAAGGGGGGSVYTKLGVNKDATTKEYVQGASVNEIGSASMNFKIDRVSGFAEGATDVWNDTSRTWDKAKIKWSPEKSALQFSQNSTVTNVITQIVLASKYVQTQMEEGKDDGKGQKQWFSIDTQVYIIDDPTNIKYTGDKPKLIVYRVIPYTVHESSLPMAPNVQPKGFDQLKNQVCKIYNYLYTGKNTEILNFDIKFDTGFAQVMADTNASSQKASAGSGGTEGTNVQSVDPGSDTPGPVPTFLNYAATLFPSDKQGGGGPDDAGMRAARAYQYALTKSLQQMDLNMDIVGDPYYIAQSGVGNYTSAQTTYQNLNNDGSISYQNGQVDIIVVFRTPTDLNQSTGLYNFGANLQNAPVKVFSGYYYVYECKSTFRQGKFTQTISGVRRLNQDAKVVASDKQIVNVSNSK